MAEGRSNSAIAQRLFVSEKAVTKHSTSIFAKLGLPPSEDDNRRVLAVLAYLDAGDHRCGQPDGDSAPCSWRAWLSLARKI